MKKILSLLHVSLLLLLSLVSCNGAAPELEEVKPRIIELIEASYEINDIFFGDGIDRVDYEEEYQKIIDDYAPGLAAAQQALNEAQQAYDSALAAYGEADDRTAAAAQEVENAQTEVKKNTYMFTKEQFIEQYDTDLTYTPVKSEKYLSVEDIKAEAEKVYSTTYLMSIYETAFVGYVEDGMTDMLYARYYEGPDGLMIHKEAEVWVTDKRIYDYDSMKIVRPSGKKSITVEFSTHLEGQTETLPVRLTFVKQGDEWFLNSPSY